MQKKIAAVFFIAAIIIMSFPHVSTANPALLLTAPVEYLIGTTMAGAGVKSSDKEAQDKAVYDYWQHASDANKKGWIDLMVGASAAYSITTGKVKITNGLWNDIRSHAQNKYHSGDNSVKYTTENGGNTEIQNQIATVYGTGVTEMHYICRDATAQDSKDYPGCYGNAPYDKCVLFWCVYTTADGVIHTQGPGYSTKNHGFVTWVQGNNYYYHRWYFNGANGTDERDGGVGSVSISGTIGSNPVRVVGNVENVHNYTGATTLNNPNWDWTNTHTGEREIPVPPGERSEIPDDSWIDQLEKDMNKTPEEIIDLNPDVDWYIDKDGNLYKKPKPSEPNNPGDKKIGVPLWPDSDTEEVPDITQDEVHEPTVTEVVNPDGTTTRTTTRTTERTTTTTDPETGDKTITKTIIKTITITIINTETGQTVSESTTTETTPDGTKITHNPNGPGIDWEPLKTNGSLFTYKFPFSLPWDLMRSFKQMEYDDGWEPVFHIDVPAPIYQNKFKFDIDLTKFNPIVAKVRVIELVLFDVGLILITRKLMGGTV